MKLTEVLSGRAGAEGIRRLLGSPAARTAIRNELSALSARQDGLGPLHLRDIRFRLAPGAKLRACFGVAIPGEGGRGTQSRAVTVIWKQRWIGDVGAAQKMPEVTQMEDEAWQRGVGAPFRRLAVQVPSWGMRVQVWPLDPRFPRLVLMADPNYALRSVATACASGHRTSPLALESRCTITVVRYVPGQRHVLRYDPLDSAKGWAVFAKLYSDGQAGRMFEAAQRVAETLQASEPGIAALAPLGYAPDDGAVFYPRILGQPLSGRVARRGGDTGRALQLAGRALRALHQASPAFVGALPAYSFEGELAEVAEKFRPLSVLAPSLAAAVSAHLDRARELHANLAQEPHTATHGDVKAEHFWLTAEGLTVMDTDFCRLGEPALDLGQFLAELRLWDDLHGQGGAEEAQEQFLAGYAPGIPTERLLRARLYESLELVKVAARRVPLSDRHWETRVASLVACAIRLLEGLRPGPGWPRALSGRRPRPISGRFTPTEGTAA